MNTLQLYDEVTQRCSKITTLAYSTSFSLGIKTLHPSLRDGIYAIYGYVRFADEIVDTFHGYDKRKLLSKFKQETQEAIADGISLNPILHSFQKAYHRYGIEWKHVETFLHSMSMDLDKHEHNENSYQTYILGSAEVVGLMCLRVFVKGDNALYDHLEPSAMRLGAAFQKINFLRDLKDDKEQLGRMYFPNLLSQEFDQGTKTAIEKEIAEDFRVAYQGIIQLPKESRYGVYLAYTYYYKLFLKIQALKPERVLQERVRIPNPNKLALMFGSYVKHNLNML
jgi:phytoene/squalene synthetase